MIRIQAVSTGRGLRHAHRRLTPRSDRSQDQRLTRSSSTTSASRRPQRRRSAQAKQASRLQPHVTQGPPSRSPCSMQSSCLARMPARAQQDERSACTAAKHYRSCRPAPVARISHRRELPGLQLLGRHLGDALQSMLQSGRKMLWRVHWGKRRAQQALEVGSTAHRDSVPLMIARPHREAARLPRQAAPRAA